MCISSLSWDRWLPPFTWVFLEIGEWLACWGSPLCLNSTSCLKSSPCHDLCPSLWGYIKGIFWKMDLVMSWPHSHCSLPPPVSMKKAGILESEDLDSNPLSPFDSGKLPSPSLSSSISAYHLTCSINNNDNNYYHYYIVSSLQNILINFSGFSSLS